MIQGFVNPIPKQIESVSEIFDEYSSLNDVAKKLAIVPRFGGSFGYSRLITEVTKSLSNLSPSQEACVNQITRWTFGGVLDIKRDSVPGLREYPPIYDYAEQGGIIRVKDESEALGREEKVKFTETLAKYGMSLTKILKVLNQLEATQMRQVSDAYLLLRVVKVGRSKKVYMSVLDYTRCAVVDQGGKKNLALMYASDFNTETWTKDNMPKFYSLSSVDSGFKWREKNNVAETVLRITQSSGRYYSKPITSPILYSMYNEIVLDETITKLVGSEFIAKAFIAFEGQSAREAKANNQSDMEVGAEAFRELTTTRHGHNNQRGSALALIEYGAGKKPPVVGKFAVNRDTAWIETVSRGAVRKIYSVHGWPPELTGQESQKSGRSGDDRIQTYIAKDEDVIRPLQYFYESVFSAIFNELGNNFGIKLPYTISAVRHIEEMVNRMAIANR